MTIDTTTKGNTKESQMIEHLSWGNTSRDDEAALKGNKFAEIPHYLSAYEGLTPTINTELSCKERINNVREVYDNGGDETTLTSVVIDGERWVLTGDRDIYGYFGVLITAIQETTGYQLSEGLYHVTDHSNDVVAIHGDLFFNGPSHTFLLLLSHTSAKTNDDFVKELFALEGMKESFHRQNKTFLPEVMTYTEEHKVLEYKKEGIRGAFVSALILGDQWYPYFVSRVHGIGDRLINIAVGTVNIADLTPYHEKDTDASLYDNRVFCLKDSGTRVICYDDISRRDLSQAIKHDKVFVIPFAGVTLDPDDDIPPRSDYAFAWDYSSSAASELVPISSLTDPKWNKGLWEEELILDSITRDVIHTIVSTEPIVKDVVNNKGNADILLFSGPPGLGKTLVGEAIAEYLEKPLIKLRMMSLKLDQGVEAFEKSLLSYTKAAKLTGGILQINEADILIEARRPGDLKRNGLVNAFLDIMEYTEGTVMLNTNRETHIDPAVWSRMTHTVQFSPDMIDQYRLWERLFERSPFPVPSSETLQALADMHINARTARNLVDVLARIASVKEEVPSEEEMLTYIAQMNKHSERATSHQPPNEESLELEKTGNELQVRGTLNTDFSIKEMCSGSMMVLGGEYSSGAARRFAELLMEPTSH